MPTTVTPVALMYEAAVNNGNPRPPGLSEAFTETALDPRLHEPVTHYLAALARWNRVHNLTRVDNPVEAYFRHVDESLSLRRFIEDADGPPAVAQDPCDSESAASPPIAPDTDAPPRRLIDIGTGAGVPGLLLAIAAAYTGRPALDGVTLVEPAHKRVAFLRTMMADLGLTQVEVCAERIERLAASEDHRGRFTVATSRAFADPERWLSVAAPLVCRGGRALVMLAGRPDRWRPVPMARDLTPYPDWAGWRLTELAPQRLKARAPTKNGAEGITSALDAPPSGPAQQGLPTRHIAVFTRA